MKTGLYRSRQTPSPPKPEGTIFNPASPRQTDLLGEEELRPAPLGLCPDPLRRKSS